MGTEGFPYKLYLVTDEAACLGRNFFWVLEEALKGGVDLVQLREKNLPVPEFLEKAKRCMDICCTYGVPLIINDVLDVATISGAHGLHLGQNDLSVAMAKAKLGEAFPVGLSIDRRSDLLLPDAMLAWYYGVSPIFSTPTKLDTVSEWGLEGLAWLRAETSKPLVAIGNIRQDNAAAVIEHGADCLAVVTAICGAARPAHAAESLMKIITKVNGR
nr:thiamine phosphate synthase [Cytophagales bacterium]